MIDNSGSSRSLGLLETPKDPIQAVENGKASLGPADLSAWNAPVKILLNYDAYTPRFADLKRRCSPNKVTAPELATLVPSEAWHNHV